MSVFRYDESWLARLGRHIIVYGPTGSGKTSFANQVGELLGLPVVDLDAIFWRDGWHESPIDEFRAQVQDILSQSKEGWVIAGNYSQVRDLILAEANSAIWLRLPLRA